jgi:hypothetical protein
MRTNPDRWFPRCRKLLRLQRPPACRHCQTAASRANLPTITSGPGVVPGFGLGSAGKTIDFGSPLTSCVTSIGCIRALMEIFPTAESASAGRPRAAANSFDIRSRPPWNRVTAPCIVIVLMSFDFEKREACFRVAHSHVERRLGRELFDDELLERGRQQ